MTREMGATCNSPQIRHFSYDIATAVVKGFAKKCLLTFQDGFCLCELCGHETGNDAQFAVSWGRCDEKLLHMCKWCLQDFELLGFVFNQILKVARGGFVSEYA